MKRYVAEFLGTFFLALAVNMTGDAMAIGLMLMAVVYILGPVSGGYFNPAVSFAMFMHRKISASTLVGYIVAQVAGAAAFLGLAYGAFATIVPTRIIPTELVLGAGSFELLLAMVLSLVVVAVTSCARFKDSHVNGMVIGLTLAAVAMCSGLCNPALAFGSMVSNMIGGQAAMPGVKEAVVYLVLPLVGGALAAMVYNYFYSNQSEHQMN